MSEVSSLARSAAPAALAAGLLGIDGGHVEYRLPNRRALGLVEKRDIDEPGCTESTRTPWSAQCSAIFFVGLRAAPFAVWQAGEVANPPLVPKMELILVSSSVIGLSRRQLPATLADLPPDGVLTSPGRAA